MDGGSRRRRDINVSLRTRQWEMVETFEELMAALVRPISHYGQSFDRDDSGLLEQYLSIAGIHALDEHEQGRAVVLPNYAQIGILLQTCATNFGKKVDILCEMAYKIQAHLCFGESVGGDDPEETGESPPPGSTAARRRRDGTPAGPSDFAPIQVSVCPGARRRSEPCGPPPVLPRVYEELQPRAPRPERALHDHAGEPIGSLDDFHVSWRLADGLLVEELESSGSEEGTAEEELRPLSLLELQAACARAAAPAPPALSPHTPPPSSPVPSPPPLPPLDQDTPSPVRMPPPAAALARKRRSEVRLDELLAGAIDMAIDTELLSEAQEYSLPERWIRRVVRHRADEILSARRNAPAPPKEFRGFDMAWTDIGGFLGWEASESSSARAAAARCSAALLDSDDDGFFERSSSLGDSARHSLDHAPQQAPAEMDGLDLESWQARVLQRAAASSPLDMQRLARDVSRALPPPPAALPWPELAAAVAPAQPQRSRVLLDILMRATRGDVEIIQGEPLTIDSFSVRMVDRDAAMSLGEELAWPPSPASPTPASPAGEPALPDP